MTRSNLRTRLRTFAAGGLAAASLALPAAAQQEPPMLQPRVDAGELPPLAERMPTGPLVVEPFDELGRYGGNLRSNMRGPSDIMTLVRTVGYENLTRWDNWQPGDPSDGLVPEVVMNLAESVDVNEDATVFTFHLREGVRWSDGEPYDTDDVMFWYDHVYSNSELMPVKPSWSVVEGQPLVAEKIDAYTFTFTFPSSHGLLLTSLATPVIDPDQDIPGRPTTYPEHYLRQFHAAFNDNADQEAREAGMQSWVDRFHNVASAYRNPDVPTLHPWVVTTGVGQGTGEEVVFERNPYYWKVDPEGNQLPYIDTVTVDLTADKEVVLLRAANGDYDFLDTYIGFVTTPENRGTFYDNQERGNYHFREVLPNRANLNILSLNQTAKDPVKRELFQQKNFRIALSHAINLEEIIELVYLGQGRPYQVAERPESPLFDEEMATQYTAYDPALANSMLDELGYTERNSSGIRLGPDGNPITIVLDIAVVRQPWLDSAELIRGYWNDVGVELVINTIERTALWERATNNEYEATVWSASGGADTLFNPRYYFPYDFLSFYATSWGQYYEGNANPEEPPAAIKTQQQLYDQILAEPDADRRTELFREIMDISKDQFYAFGIMQPTRDYGIQSNKLHNMPQTMMASTIYTYPGASNLEQYYFSE
ncbi:ABC transporter substrate-binding protein [Mesobacterium pallidum]|uniref:ABC transporter substrate-binding protein n=1 Tax=Mesobacterium pallidum TaxID=2872037 RepID=UPI001EE2AF69|nr:ABC transporter substrate-binding protein [Mesobacterium pallidum]